MSDTEAFSRLFDLMERYRAGRNSGKLVDYYAPAQLRKKLDLGAPATPESYDELFVWAEKYLQYSVKTGHPQFWNRMWADANMPAMIGEMVSTLAHTSACTFESAPVSTEMEKYLIDEFLGLAGYEAGEGQMTTGSSNGNLIAMMAARNAAVRNAKTQGLVGTVPLVAFVNAEAHYSMDKAANVLGIGTENLIKIPVDERGRLRVDVLEREIMAAKDAGKTPFFVAATAGTTLRGAYDAIYEINALKEKCGHDFWHHVDGAWGGTAFLSKKLTEHFMRGLGKTHSFTFDFHKMHGIPMVCNFLLINGHQGRAGRVLQSTIASGNDDYIFRGADNERPADLGAVSLQCGRHTDILKLFLAWKFYGRAGFVDRFERFLQRAEFAETCVLAAPELELLAPRESFNINFRYIAPAGFDADDLNKTIRQNLYESGTAMVGLGQLNGQTTVRLLIANESSTDADVEAFFAAFITEGKKITDAAAA